MTRTRRTRAALVALATVGGGVLTAGPAAAAPPVITFTTPASGARVTSSATKVDAKVTMPDGRLKSISLALTPLSGGGAAVNPPPVPGGDAASKDVSFPLTLAFNGHYKAEITATGNDTLLGIGPDISRKGAVEFFMVAPPAAPRSVRTSVDAGTREVTVSWARNAEADMLFYLVQRSLGGGEYVLAAKTTELTIVDSTTAQAGGEYSYQVVAVRAGATAEEGINSNPSTVSAAGVPAPPAPPTTAPATPGETVVSVPTSTAISTPGSTAPAQPSATVTTIAPSNPGALTRSGTVDLSGLRALQAQPPPPRRVSPPTTVDTGFDEALPFDTSTAPEELEGSFEPEGSTEFDETALDATELGAEDDIEKTRALAFLAAGLLATVLLMHLLWVRGEVDRVPLEALPPGPPAGKQKQKQKRPRPSRPPVAARRPGGPRPAPGPRPGPDPRLARPRPGPDPRKARPRPAREDLPIG